MNQSLAITAIGEDRPGIVNELTEVLLNANLNIEDSRMSVLGGEFAIILLVTGNDASIQSIQQKKNELETALNLSLLVKSTTSRRKNNDLASYTIKVEGMDNPGIVHKLARYLSQQGINIVNMQTQSSHAPHTGTPIFTVDMLVDIPAAHNIDQVQDEFTKVCDGLSMDAEFKSA